MTDNSIYVINSSFIFIIVLILTGLYDKTTILIDVTEWRKRRVSFIWKISFSSRYKLTFFWTEYSLDIYIYDQWWRENKELVGEFHKSRINVISVSGWSAILIFLSISLFPRFYWDYFQELQLYSKEQFYFMNFW